MTGSGQVSPCLATQHQYASRDVPGLHGRFERSQRAETIVGRTVRITPPCACLAPPHQIVSPFGTVTRRSQLVPVGLAKGSADPRAYRQSEVNKSWLAKSGNRMRPASRTRHRCRPPCPALTVPERLAGVPRSPDRCQETGDRRMIHLHHLAETDSLAPLATHHLNCTHPGAQRLARPANARAGPLTEATVAVPATEIQGTRLGENGSPCAATVRTAFNAIQRRPMSRVQI